MFHHSFGNKVCIDAVRDYLTKLQFETATPEQLYDSLQSQVDKAHLLENMNVLIKDMMNSWANQSGYPVVNVTLVNGTMILKQVRYIFFSIHFLKCLPFFFILLLEKWFL